MEDSTDGKEKTAASSASTETEADVAWMAMSAFLMEADDLFEAPELPDLTQLPETDNEESDSDLDERSAEFKDEDTDDEDDLLVDSAVCSTKKARDLPDEVHTTISSYAKTELEDPIDIKLYEAGPFGYVTGYHHCFSNFVTFKYHPMVNNGENVPLEGEEKPNEEKHGLEQDKEVK